MADILITRSRSKLCLTPITKAGENWLNKTFIMETPRTHILDREHEEDIIKMIEDIGLEIDMEY